MISKLLRLGGLLAAIFAMALPTASAQDFVVSGPGSDIPDFNPATGPGNAISVTTITANDGITIGDLAVCINGLEHTWVGDLIATITHVDLNGNQQNATLFNRVGRGGFDGDGDASNFDGDYEFATNGANLFEESALGAAGNGSQGSVDDEFVISPGTYANSNSLGFDNNTNPAVASSTSLAALFGGRNSAGIWTIRLTDNDINDIGSFDSTSIKFFGAATAVPEPGTFGLMAVAGVGGFFYVRRKKKKSSDEPSEEVAS